MIAAPFQEFAGQELFPTIQSKAARSKRADQEAVIRRWSTSLSTSVLEYPFSYTALENSYVTAV